MKRTFITFSYGDLNDQLLHRLKFSLDKFSNYELQVYREKDFDIKYNTSDPEFWQSGNGYVFKVLSCLKALEQYDEVVWIDTDCLVTNYIDKIWFESWRLNNFPLLPKYRFSMFGNNSSNIEVPMTIQVEKSLDKVKDIIPFTERIFYSQACFMYFNKSCRSFFEEVLSYLNNFNKEIFPYKIFDHSGGVGDESIINFLFWKYNFTDNLGEIFLCSHYFNYSLENTIKNKNRENFSINLSILPERNNFENILFFHGTKSIELTDYLLDCLLNHRLAK